MRQRTGYVVSLLVHGLGFWALAAHGPALDVRLAIRQGEAAVVAQSARARSAETPLDSRVEMEPIAEPMPVVEPVPPPDEPPRSPPTVLPMDERIVHRPPLEELIRRRSERQQLMAALPDAPLRQLDVPETVPESEGRPTRLDLPQIPEEQSAPPERVDLAAVVPRAVAAPLEPIVDPGDADKSALGSNATQGAKLDQFPKVLPNNREPVYPEELRRQRVTGLVQLRVTIDRDGSVAEVSVVESSGHRAFDAAALEAVRAWRFEPARRGSAAVSATVRLPIRFSLRP